MGRDPFNQNFNRSDREKWSTSKGGPVFSKRLDQTDPLSFGPKFPEILVEWIAPMVPASFSSSRILKSPNALTAEGLGRRRAGTGQEKNISCQFLTRKRF